MLASKGAVVPDSRVMRTLFSPCNISLISVASFGRKSSLKAYSAKMELSITRPDDWHLHLRDGDVLKAVVSHSAHHFGRAIVMPNLKPPITTTAAAVAYREAILKSLPADSDFNPLMTLYLTDTTSPMEIKLARESQVVFGVKLYPAGATTNSQDGVTDLFGKCLPVLQEMVEHNMPLLACTILLLSSASFLILQLHSPDFGEDFIDAAYQAYGSEIPQLSGTFLLGNESNESSIEASFQHFLLMEIL